MGDGEKQKCCMCSKKRDYEIIFMKLKRMYKGWMSIVNNKINIQKMANYSKMTWYCWVLIAFHLVMSKSGMDNWEWIKRNKGRV